MIDLDGLCLFLMFINVFFPTSNYQLPTKRVKQFLFLGGGYNGR